MQSMGLCGAVAVLLQAGDDASLSMAALHLEEVRGLRLHEVAQLPPLELAPVDGEDPIADGEHA